MKKIKISILLLFLLPYQLLQAQSQEVEYIRIPELEKILKNPENKLFVVNFWATWCPPCVKEFPHFEKVSKEYKPEKVKFLMVSLDFPNQVEKQLIPFLKKNKTSLNVAVMMDVDYNAWIDKVETKWQGEIPATLFFNNSKKIRHFHSGEVDESELRNLINTYM